jgi:hypothetical protein
MSGESDVLQQTSKTILVTNHTRYCIVDFSQISLYYQVEFGHHPRFLPRNQYVTIGSVPPFSIRKSSFGMSYIVCVDIV